MIILKNPGDPILIRNKIERDLMIMRLFSTIKDVLDTKDKIGSRRDGGDIKFKSFENGVVKVELQYVSVAQVNNDLKTRSTKIC